MAIIVETCPKCGHDLRDEVICTYPPIPRKVCLNCGWSWEGEREEVVRVPFGSLNGNVNNRTTVTTLNGNLNTLTVNALTTAETSKLDLNYDILNDSFVSNVANVEKSPCDNCPNNIKNGGSGVCHCILGTPKIT